ncbi:Tat pathway signal sequence, partial [Salmonella enterica subsp. enterica serovar Derby]
MSGGLNVESYSTNIPGLKTKARRREFMKWSAVVGGAAALAPELPDTKDPLANK